jgi:hypothetical protein
MTDILEVHMKYRMKVKTEKNLKLHLATKNPQSVLTLSQIFRRK